MTGAGADFGLADLGEFRLRDLLEPERLFQLEIDGDSGSYPPPNALDRYDTNLPVLRTGLIGRESEVAAVRGLLASNRIVTMTGVGAVGKTRLSLEIASRELGEYDGVFFVDLSVVSDPDQVLAAVASGLDIPNAGSVDATTNAVTRMLRRFPSLIVLDNCEHLLDATADLVDELTAQCPKCRILAISREPLGITGEVVWRIPSLDDDASLELFRERALAVRSDAVLDEPKVRALCAQLDGIALAVELAASRVSHLSVEEILSHLDERFELLTGGRRRARQRHQTLEAMMDWSYDLLASDEQAALRACSVFSAGFTADALAAVIVRSAAAARNIVGALVDKSLVVIASVTAGVTRYRLLETVRLYAQGKLMGAGEAQGLRTRHAAYFASLAEQAMLTRSVFGVSGDRADDEEENFIAAAEWADGTGDLRAVARIATGLSLGAPGAWVDSTWRFLERDEVKAALLSRALVEYVVAGARNANYLGDYPRQLVLAAEAIETGIDAVTLGHWAHGLLANAQSIFSPDEADATIAAGTRLHGDQGESYAGLYARRVDVAIMRGRLEEALDLMRSVHYTESVREAEIVLVTLGRFDEAEQMLNRSSQQAGSSVAAQFRGASGRGASGAGGS